MGIWVARKIWQNPRMYLGMLALSPRRTLVTPCQPYAVRILNGQHTLRSLLLAIIDRWYCTGEGIVAAPVCGSYLDKSRHSGGQFRKGPCQRFRGAHPRRINKNLLSASLWPVLVVIVRFPPLRRWCQFYCPLCNWQMDRRDGASEGEAEKGSEGQ